MALYTAYIRLYKDKQLVGYETYSTNKTNVTDVFYDVIAARADGCHGRLESDWKIISVVLLGAACWGKRETFF